MADWEATLRLAYGEAGARGTGVAPQQFRPPGGSFLLAVSGDEPRGCGGLRGLDARTGEIKRLFVDPEARGQGVAAILLSALTDRAVALGYSHLRLDTTAGNQAALGLFRAAGFQDIPDYNANPLAGHWFEKDLAEGP